MKYDPEMIKPMREEVTRLGVEELKTPEDVKDFLDDEGTQLIFINSVCGCAGSSSRPAIEQVIDHEDAPDKFGTVFAGQDDEATEYVRSLAPDVPPSSPSFFIYRDGEPVGHVPRKTSKQHDADHVAEALVDIFEKVEEEAVAT